PTIFGPAQVVAGGVDVVVMSVGVDDELDIVRPPRSSVWHVDLLPITMVVRIGSIEHAEPSWRSEISAYHADIDFRLTWFRMRSRWWACVDGYQCFLSQRRRVRYVKGVVCQAFGQRERRRWYRAGQTICQW